MTRRIYDENILNYITLFESVTGAKVKDCIVNGSITFIVEKGNMGLAIGKNGSNLNRAEGILKKTLKVIEFEEDVLKFVLNCAYPIRKIGIEKQEKTVVIKGQDMKTKGLLIGRDRVNIKRILSLVQRFFDIEVV